MPRTSIWRYAPWPDLTYCNRRPGGSNCRHRAAAGSTNFVWLCGHPHRCAGSIRVYPTSLIRRLNAIMHSGAMVDDAARPGIDDEAHHRLFMLLLRAATASRMGDEEFVRQQEIALTLTEDDMSDRAGVARGATLLHRTWGISNEARTKLRYVWHEFFSRFDVLLTPVAATAAFPHNHNPNRDERTVMVNGMPAPYAEQLFFAGLASLSYLPATAAPIGLTGQGLPAGLQIIGPEGEDSTTIQFARLLASEIGGFVPPPAYT